MTNGLTIPEAKQQPNKLTSVRPNLLPGKEIFYGKTCFYLFKRWLQLKD